MIFSESFTVVALNLMNKYEYSTLQNIHKCSEIVNNINYIVKTTFFVVFDKFLNKHAFFWEYSDQRLKYSSSFAPLTPMASVASAQK